MKKIGMAIAALMLLGFQLMAGEQTLGDPYGFAPAKEGGDADKIKISVSEQEGNNYSPMHYAIKVKHEPVLVVASIGGFCGAPLSQTGVASTEYI